MSKHFTLPNNPIPWHASPRDLSGDVPDVPYMGVYTHETTQRYILGTRYITWDGRAFRYSKAGYPVNTALGAWTGDYQAIARWGEFGVAHPKGSNPIIVTTENLYDGVAYDGVFAEDVLAGGYIVLWPTGLGSTDYGIIGNDLLEAAGALTIYLDAPTRETITKDAGSCEAIFSPYRKLMGAGSTPGSSSRHPIMGVPMSTALTDEYFWVQTWGPIHIATSDAAVGSAGSNFDLVFGSNGIPMANDSGNDQLLQHCGFTLAQGGGSGGASPEQGSPFVMLQISP
jgi:hypothetical protein